jgi:transcriptional regulator with XRE-family HTH domain
MKYLANNIKYLRLKKGLSQEQFADELRVTRARICSYECTKTKPTIKFIFQLSNYSNMSIDSILKENLNKLEF